MDGICVKGRYMYRNALDKIVQESLGPTSLIDFCETKLGWLSHKAPVSGLGVKFLHSFNYPVDDFDFEYLFRWTWDANKGAVKHLYSNMNGLRLFANHFCIPGIYNSSFANDLLSYSNLPIDINTVSGFSNAKYSPERGAVIGSSFRYKNGETRFFQDVLCSDGKIISGYFDEGGEVVEVYTNFPDWIRCRVASTRSTFEEALRTPSLIIVDV